MRSSEVPGEQQRKLSSKMPGWMEWTQVELACVAVPPQVERTVGVHDWIPRVFAMGSDNCAR